jgi:hypothetical protein
MYLSPYFVRGLVPGSKELATVASPFLTASTKHQVHDPISGCSWQLIGGGLHPGTELALTPATRAAPAGPSAEFVSKNVGGSYAQPHFS